jgi:hypothetical protein
MAQPHLAAGYGSCRLLGAESLRLLVLETIRLKPGPDSSQSLMADAAQASEVV